MTHYLAIVEEGDEAHAYGMWFPDLPGCFSGGDTFEEAMLNAREAVATHIDLLQREGMPVPVPRTLADLRKDPGISSEINQFMVAVVPFHPLTVQTAAE